ncbi:MAG: hypothetical protein OCD01_03335 [Fibrobacterales bacterium]
MNTNLLLHLTIFSITCMVSLSLISCETNDSTEFVTTESSAQFQSSEIIRSTPNLSSEEQESSLETESQSYSRSSSIAWSLSSTGTSSNQSSISNVPLSSSTNTLSSNSSVSSSATAIPLVPPSNGSHSLLFEGITREYRLFVPTTYSHTSPHKLILLFHGWGEDHNAFLEKPLFTQQAEDRGYILVAPRGLSDADDGLSRQTINSWRFKGSSTGITPDNQPLCNTATTTNYGYESCDTGQGNNNNCAWTHCIQDDVAFIIHLIANIKTTLNIDENNVFAFGASNGGMFTWELGQNSESAPLFRAIAPTIGQPHRGYSNGPGKPGSLPALLITGTDDSVVPPGNWEATGYSTSDGNDAYYYVTASVITKSWSEHHCSEGLSLIQFDDGYAETDCRSWCATKTEWPEVLDCRATMGHEFKESWGWPLVLDFFDKHSVQ